MYIVCVTVELMSVASYFKNLSSLFGLPHRLVAIASHEGVALSRQCACFALELSGALWVARKAVTAVTITFCGYSLE